MKFKIGDHVRSTMNQWRAVVTLDSNNKVVFELKSDAAGNPTVKRIDYDKGMESSLELDPEASDLFRK